MIAREKILPLARLEAECTRARRRKERIVLTNGCFDLLHVGHLRSLEQARSLGDRLIVAINSDASVRRLKGRERPIQSARTRRELVAGLACVDWVIGFRTDTPLALIRTLQPDILAKGGDYALSEIAGAADVLAAGGRVVRLDLIPGESTTESLARLRAPTGRRPRHKR